MPVSTAKAKPAFDATAPQFAVNDRVMYRGRGIGLVSGIAEQDVHGIKFEAMTVTFPWPEYDAASGGTQSFPVRKAGERLRALTEDKDTWGKIFTLLSGNAQASKRVGRDQLARYATMLQTGDLKDLATILRDNRDAVGGNVATGVSVPFIFEVNKAMSLLCIELAAVTGRDVTECKLHLKKIVTDKLANPMRIFDFAYEVEAIAPKVKVKKAAKNGTVPVGPPTESIEAELDLTLPIARAIHDSAFKSLNVKTYPPFVRRFLSRDIAQRIDSPVVDATSLKKGYEAVPKSMEKELTLFQTMSHKRYLRNMPGLAGSLVHPVDMFNELFKAVLAQGGLVRLNGMVDMALEIRRTAATSQRGPKAPAPE